MRIVCLLLALAAQHTTSPPIIVERVAASGTVQIAEEGAATKPPSRGTMTVWFRYYLEWHPQDIPIIDGKWSAVVPHPCSGVDIGRIVLDGADAHVPTGSWPEDPGRGPIHLTATLAATVKLTVLDSESDAPVSDFEVREWGSEWNGFMMPLGDDEGWVVHHPTPGPVSLPAWSLDPDPSFVPGVQWTPRRTFWVRANGKAWTRVNADFDHGGDVVARLHPARSMRVVIGPDRTTRNLLLEIRIDGGKGFVRLDTGTKERLFENLPDTRVEAILFDEMRTPLKELTRQTVTLAPGAATIVLM